MCLSIRNKKREENLLKKLEIGVKFLNLYGWKGNNDLIKPTIIKKRKMKIKF